MQKSILSSLVIFWSVLCFGQGVKKIQAPGEFEYSTTSNFGKRTFYYRDYANDGDIDDQEKWTYNHLGQLITSESGYRDDTEDYYYIARYTYNSDGLLVSDRRYTTAEPIIASVAYNYFYSEDNLLLQRVDSFPARPGQVTYTYNAKRLLTKEVVEKQGRYTLTTWYEYNENDSLVVKSEDYNGDGIPQGEFQYTYNDQNLLSKELYDKDGLISNVKDYVYDEDNRLKEIQMDYNNDGVLTYKIKYTYNELGQVSSYSYYNVSSGVSDPVFDHTYDFNGNLRSFTETSDGIEDEFSYEYSNGIKCDRYGDGLAHNLEVNIPQDGNWRIELCGSAFQNKLALSAVGFCEKDLGLAEEGCSSGDARIETTLTAGDYYLTVLGKDFTSDGKYKLNIERISSASISDQSISSFSVYPNPVSDVLTVNTEASSGKVSIQNALGQVVLSQEISSGKTLNVKTLNPGVYFITLTGGTATYQSKFIKQ